MPTLNNSSRQPIEKTSLWLLGLMCVLPFLAPHHQLPIPTFYSELTAALLGMAALLPLLQAHVWQDLRLPHICLLPLGLAALILLQMLLGRVTYPQMALIALEYLIWACLLMILANHLQRTLGMETFCTTLAWFLMVGGLASALLGILQKLGVQGGLLFPAGQGQSAYGNLGQPNHFADYTALALASALFLATRLRLGRAAFYAVAAGLLGGLALSASRSSWLYLMTFALLAGIDHRKQRTAESRWLMQTTLALLPAFALLQPLMQWLIQLSGNAHSVMVTERFLASVQGSSARLRIWQDALQMAWEHPWLGVGYGHFSWNSFLQIARHAPGDFSSPAEHAHNLPLHLLAELGVPALLLLGWCGWRWARARASRPLTPEHRWMWTLLAILGIHSLLEYPLWYTFFLGIAALLAGAGSTDSLKTRLKTLGRPALVLMLATGLFGLWGMALAYSTLEGVIDRVLKHQIADRELAAINETLLGIHRETLFTHYVELIYAVSSEPDMNNLEAKLMLAESVAKVAPIGAVTYRYAALLALHGEHQRAGELLAISRQAFPEQAGHYSHIPESGKPSPP